MVILPVSEAEVRLATGSDIEAVFSLATRLSSAEKHNRNLFDEVFEKVIGDYPRTHLYVAEIQAEVVGYAVVTINELLYTNGPSAQLQEIVVADTVRGEGVGTGLVRAVERACQAADVSQLTVASRRAGGFYDRLGYVQQAEYMRRLLKESVR